MAVTTITQFPELPLSAVNNAAYSFALPLDATIGGTLGTYKVTLDQVRNFVLNSTRTHTISGSTDMLLASAGNVGIGNSSPSAKLDVIGAIKTSTTVTAPGGFIGNVDTATRLQTGRTFQLKTGDVTTGLITFDGTGNVHLQTSIVPSAVTTSKIKDLNVTNKKIADGAVTAAKIYPREVKQQHILEQNVLEKHLGVNAVTVSKIKDLNVTSGKLAAGSVTNTKIASNTIDNAQLKDGIISSSKIVDGAVSTAKIANASVTTAKIGSKQVTAATIADGTVTTVHLADQLITTNKITNGAVTHGKLQTIANVAGTYYKNPKLTVNNKGIITSVLEQSESLMLSGGTLTGRLTLAPGLEDASSAGGLFWGNIDTNGDQASITWTKSSVSSRHTLRLAVTGADPADQSGSAGYGNDDRIVFEVPNLSGVSIKVDGTEYPIWHKGHVHNIVAEIQNYYDTYAFTHFIAENATGSALAAAEGNNTLTLLGSHINTALGYTAAPNTRAHITNTLGFEPLSRTRSAETLAGTLYVSGDLTANKRLFVKNDVILGSNANDIYFNVNPGSNNNYININSGNNKLTIGHAGPRVSGTNHLLLEAGGSYLQLKSRNNIIYHNAVNHQFRYKNSHPLGWFGLYTGNGHLEVGRGYGHTFEGRLFVQSGEHNGLVIAHHNSTVKLQAGITNENVTFGTKGAGRSLIKIESGAEQRDNQSMITLTTGNHLYFDTQAALFRNSDNVDKSMGIQINNASKMGAVQFYTHVNGPRHNFLEVGSNNVQLGPKDNKSLVHLRNSSGGGLVGIGTVDPSGAARLTVQDIGNTSILCRKGHDRGLFLGHNWIHRSSLYSGINNDTNYYKTLMIVGNSTSGNGRTVSVWDRMTIGNNRILPYHDHRLSIHGSARMTGNLKVDGIIETGRISESRPSDYTVVTYSASYHHQNKPDPGFYNNLNRGVYVNGNVTSNLNGRGINTFIIGPAGNLRAHKTHDTYASVKNWEKHIEWIFDTAHAGDMVVCNMQDASTGLDFHIRNARNSRDQYGESKASKHAYGFNPKAVAFYTRIGGRGMFIKQRYNVGRGNIRTPGAWAFIMPSNIKEYYAGATSGYEVDKIYRNRYHDDFNFCYVEKFGEELGYIQLRTSYADLMANGGTSSGAGQAAHHVVSAPQKMSISVNHIQANSIVKKAPDMNDYCYPPSGDALVFDNIYAGYGTRPGNHSGNQKSYEFFGLQEPYYWRDHTSTFDDWAYTYSNVRHSLWYEQNMIRIGWDNQNNHYGGLRIRIPDGVDTLWVEKHDSWFHSQLYYLYPDGTTNPGHSNNSIPAHLAPNGTGRHPRYGYRKRSGKFGTLNANYDRPYSPYDGIIRGQRHWVGDWVPIPLERKLLDEFPYVTLASVNTSSDPWLTGIAFGRNPWNHTFSSAVNLHWRLNGGDYIWWSGDWWYRQWAFAHAWHNRTVYIPCIFNGKDKVLYAKCHNFGSTGQPRGWAITVNGVPMGSLHGSFTNPFEAGTRTTHLGSGYKGIHIPADVIMRNHYDGNGHVSSATYKGDVGYIKVDLQGGYSDYHFHFSEIGTHDYAPDPYIVHTGLGNHNFIDGPHTAVSRWGWKPHPYSPGGTQFPGW